MIPINKIQHNICSFRQCENCYLMLGTPHWIVPVMSIHDWSGISFIPKIILKLICFDVIIIMCQYFNVSNVSIGLYIDQKWIGVCRFVQKRLRHQIYKQTIKYIKKIFFFSFDYSFTNKIDIVLIAIDNFCYCAINFQCRPVSTQTYASNKYSYHMPSIGLYDT